MEYPSKRKYDAKNTVQVIIKLNKNTDADIIEYLNASGNKQGTIKEALRAQIAAETEITDEAFEMMKAAIKTEMEERVEELCKLRGKPQGVKN